MTTLPDFLLARIAEDERRVEFVRGFIPDEGDQGEYINPARVLAECEAKRRIVEASRSYHESDQDPDPDDPDGGWALSIALRALALPYADHTDWREEWRP